MNAIPATPDCTPSRKNRLLITSTETICTVEWPSPSRTVALGHERDDTIGPGERGILREGDRGKLSLSGAQSVRRVGLSLVQTEQSGAISGL